MDWIRRNWPDLAIGVALLLVICAIVATLITGGSIFSLSRSADPPSVTDPSLGPSEIGGSEAADVGGPTITPLPPVDRDGPADDSVAAVPADDPVVASPVATPAPEAVSESILPLPDSSAGSGRYRVSVGAFGSRESAEALAVLVRYEGYPVFLAPEGDLTLVLVGPYNDRAEAERVAEQIQASDNGVDSTLIYTFDPEEVPEIEEVSEITDPLPGSFEEGVVEPQAGAEAARAASPLFLQVGAYGSAESMGPQVDRLSELGFKVTPREEDGLIKLLVGPFGPEELDTARAALMAEGIESFVVR
ncbi:MAG: SPOR domain-containing protein [Truepera sp.]|nr:SPOR domain-containing protein [Truepera sp.]